MILKSEKIKSFFKKCFRKRKNEETTVTVEEIVTEELQFATKVEQIEENIVLLILNVKNSICQLKF